MAKTTSPTTKTAEKAARSTIVGRKVDRPADRDADLLVDEERERGGEDQTDDVERLADEASLKAAEGEQGEERRAGRRPPRERSRCPLRLLLSRSARSRATAPDGPNGNTGRMRRNKAATTRLLAARLAHALHSLSHAARERIAGSAKRDRRATEAEMEQRQDDSRPYRRKDPGVGADAPETAEPANPASDVPEHRRMELLEERLVAKKRDQLVGEAVVRKETEEFPSRLDVETTTTRSGRARPGREDRQPARGSVAGGRYPRRPRLRGAGRDGEATGAQGVRARQADPPTEHQIYTDTLRRDRLVVEDPQNTGRVHEVYRDLDGERPGPAPASVQPTAGPDQQHEEGTP